MASNPKAQTAHKSNSYPKPTIIQPLLKHKQTIIILHGQGSNAPTFAPPLLTTPISPSQTLHTAFPHTKFIIPTASARRAKHHNRAMLTQWFDHPPPSQLPSHEEWQTAGLRETSAFIHALLSAEIHDVGAGNVILGGLSQGCAAALIALLTWQGEPLGAAFGMCGWLPFCAQMAELANPVSNDGEGDDADLFEKAGGEVAMGPGAQAVGFLCEELGMDVEHNGSAMSFQRTPLFLGHGVLDEKVPLELGQGAASCLKGMGMSVEWKEYVGLAHWYSGPMLGDLVKFLQHGRGVHMQGEECLDSPCI